MSDRNCLYCDVSEEYVKAVRSREGYTLGCGNESSTESGFDYEEYSTHHRWASWKDAELDTMGFKPEAFAKYRRAGVTALSYPACEDTKRGHNWCKETVPEWGDVEGCCFNCGTMKGTT